MNIHSSRKLFKDFQRVIFVLSAILLSVSSASGLPESKIVLKHARRNLSGKQYLTPIYRHTPPTGFWTTGGVLCTDYWGNGLTAPVGQSNNCMVFPPSDYPARLNDLLPFPEEIPDFDDFNFVGFAYGSWTEWDSNTTPFYQLYFGQARIWATVDLPVVEAIRIPILETKGFIEDVECVTVGEFLIPQGASISKPYDLLVRNELKSFQLGNGGNNLSNCIIPLAIQNNNVNETLNYYSEDVALSCVGKYYPNFPSMFDQMYNDFRRVQGKLMFIWKATDPSGAVIHGPSGIGKYYWNTPTALSRKLGKYHITCTIQHTDGKSIDVNTTYNVVGAKVEVTHVNRDVMSSQWAQATAFDHTKPAIYAGPNSGDMVEWRIKDDGIFGNPLMTWSAIRLESNEGIRGPRGIGLKFWRIANEGGNDPLGDQWLKWKPGTYLIMCRFSNKDYQVQLIRVGYRSDQILVIGQIVQTHTHDVDEPTGAALATWADAIADDLSGTLSTAAGIMPGITEDILYGLIRPKVSSFPPNFAEAWTGVWSGGIPGIAAPVLPPFSRGPATKSFGLNLCGPVGTITASQRYWMIQHLLNTNSDTPELSDTLTTSVAETPNGKSLPEVFGSKQYRFLQRFQARFLLDAQGRIENPASRVFPNIADVGPTKLNVGLAIGEIGSIAGFPIPWNIWSTNLPTEPAEPSPYNGAVSYSADGKSISGYASARIGLKGQQASYRQFGKDAPWIFSEVILQLDPQGEVQLMGRTSTTVQWKFDTSGAVPAMTLSRSPAAPASIPGISIFNNLNIYTRSTPDQFIRLPGGLLEMEGHLSSFVESASGAWPEPPITPSIR